MAPPFPADRLDAWFRRRLRALPERAPPEDDPANIAVRFCHWTPDGEHAPWAGVRGVVRELRAAMTVAVPIKPILIVGPHSLERVRGLPEVAVLDWPGAAYVRYDASEQELLSAVEQVLQGAKEPLPPGLLADLGEILKAAVDVRHWLQTRLEAAEGALADLGSAIRGENSLHQSYLEPVEAISRRHREMLEHLKAAVACLAPPLVELRAVRTAVEGFVLHWTQLEHARRRLRNCPDRERNEALTHLRDRYIEVREALVAAIAAIEELDGTLKQRRE